MARVEITETVLRPDATGGLLAVTGSSVQVNKRAGGAATLYTTASGSTQITQPLTTRYGRVEPAATPGGEVWIAPGSYDLVVDGTTTQRFEASVGSGTTGAVTPFLPEDYGAVRDGVTNDTPAIKACIAAAVAACQADGTNYCEVQFSAGTYLLSSATTVGGATLGNAQIPMPVIVPETTPKVMLVLKGGGKASAMHWAQTTPLVMGTVLKTTLTGQTADGTYGAPSVIGGPNAQVGSNGLAPWFSNLHVVIDGITVLKPQNPSLVSFDMRGVAQMTIGNASSLVNATAAALSGNPGSNGLGVGLMCPAAGNNAVADIGSFTSEGDNTGVVISEHVAAQRFLCLYNVTALFIDTSRNVSTNHASTIQYMCAEACTTVIDNDNAAGNVFAINIAACDVEVLNSGTHIADSLGILRGQVNWHDYALTTPRVTGAANLRIIDTTITRGAFTPSLPATTVASTPLFRDMALTVSGGTVTAITVDGVAQGITSGTVFVPTGKTFAITYSVAPTLRAVKF